MKCRFFLFALALSIVERPQTSIADLGLETFKDAVQLGRGHEEAKNLHQSCTWLECLHRYFNKSAVKAFGDISESELNDSSAAELASLFGISLINAWRLVACSRRRSPFHKNSTCKADTSWNRPPAETSSPNNDTSSGAQHHPGNTPGTKEPGAGGSFRWSEYDVERDAPRYDDESWTPDAERWRTWWPEHAIRAAEYVFSGLNQTDGQSLCPPDGAPLEELDFPAFVVGLERRAALAVGRVGNDAKHAASGRRRQAERARRGVGVARVAGRRRRRVPGR